VEGVLEASLLEAALLLLEVEPLVAPASSTPLLLQIFSPVISASLFFVVEHFVGLCNLLELVLCGAQQLRDKQAIQRSL
jgi:hypothetical protein